MGLRKGICKLLHPIKAVTEHARDTIEDLEDNVDHWRDEAAREHDLRIEGLADAKVAVARAKYEGAITQANGRVAIAEAEARGIAQGNVLGYQRALDETDLYDAGFDGGRQRSSMSNAKQSSYLSGPHALTGPPASLGGKRFMSERSGRSNYPPQPSKCSDHLFMLERSGHSSRPPRPSQHSDHRTSHLKAGFKDTLSHASTRDTKLSTKGSVHRRPNPSTDAHPASDHIRFVTSDSS